MEQIKWGQKEKKLNEHIAKRNIEKIEEIEEIAKIQDNNELLKGVYVFVSMDLTNSTLFKSRHKNMWPKFVSSFYDTVMDNFGLLRFRHYAIDDNEKIEDKEMNSNVIYHIGEFQLWKTVGDEVLLYSRVPNWEILYNIIVHIDNKRKVIIEKTIEKTISNTFSGRQTVETEKELEIAKEHEQIYKQYFDIKTTVWIASCAGDIKEISANSYPNLAYKSTNYSNEEIYNNLEHLDFMGPDIDEGFRLCEYAEKKQMIISPKLMYLLILLKKNDGDKINILNLNFKIVNYVSMKGVWENRLYPIIMFCQHNPGCSELESWNEMFEYDAFENSLLYANIDKYKEKFFQDKRYSILNLENIYENAVRQSEMDALENSFKRQEEAMKEIKETKLVEKRSKFEFHISCLCYKDGKFWVTNHSKHGWSFGCIQVSQNTNYFKFVEHGYSKKYNLDIKLSEKNDILSFYSVTRDKVIQESILGIVILVTDVVDIIESEEVNKGEWHSFEETKELIGKKIGNFDEILQKAYNVLKEKGVVSSGK